jgi:two-component system sensor histidine kinase BaeS
VALLLVLLAAVLSFPLARRLVRPIRALADATHRLSAGEFTTRVPVDSQDELGRLASDFNILALTLESNEKARRQWVADISHELRTPVAVMRGEIEAIQDGIRQCSSGTVDSLHGEILRLSRLVDDLHQLAMSDLGALTYRKQRIDLAEILTDAVEGHRNEFATRKIDISIELPPHRYVPIFGDEGRLHQLLANLLDNSLKYTSEGGRLLISMSINDGKVIIDFKDSAPSVSDTDLERLFERLYRAESSRNRSTGGAGLGLSICRNIVEVHGGSIVAQKSELGGIWVRVELPIEGGC